MHLIIPRVKPMGRGPLQKFPLKQIQVLPMRQPLMHRDAMVVGGRGIATAWAMIGNPPQRNGL